MQRTKKFKHKSIKISNELSPVKWKWQEVSIFIFVNKGIRITAGVDIPQLPAKPRPSEAVVQ
jgi:hypothetical protein